MLGNKRMAFIVMIEMFWVDVIQHNTLDLVHETRAFTTVNHSHVQACNSFTCSLHRNLFCLYFMIKDLHELVYQFSFYIFFFFFSSLLMNSHQHEHMPEVHIWAVQTAQV